MDCSSAWTYLLGYLKNELSVSERLAFETHIASCDQCRLEFEDYRELWSSLEHDRELNPSLESRIQFQRYLDNEISKSTDLNEAGGSNFGIQRFKKLWPTSPGSALAYSIVLGFCGFLIGQLASSGINTQIQSRENQEIVSIQAELTEMRNLMSTTLLVQDSIQARLRGVEFARESGSSDPQLINLLLEIVESDPASNVRLAALDVLEQHRDNLIVQERLYRSLSVATSPLEQLHKAELLLNAAGNDRSQLLDTLIMEQVLEASVIEFLQAMESNINQNQLGGRLIEL